MRRPVTYTPHLFYDKLDRYTYKCSSCGFMGNAWEMSYTTCSNFVPPHGDLRRITRGKDDWACVDCNARGKIDDLRQEACPSFDPEPCDYCNVSVQCAIDCPGIAEVLGSENIYLTGSMDVPPPEALEPPEEDY